MVEIRTPPSEEYRSRRKAMGLTQQQLAAELGLGRDTIVARETGKTRLIAEHFHALCAVEHGGLA